jgi:hypothetical protein
MQKQKEEQSQYQIETPVRTSVAYLPGFEDLDLNQEEDTHTPIKISHKKENIIFEDAGHMGYVHQ